jgi:hypothetical protein
MTKTVVLWWIDSGRDRLTSNKQKDIGSMLAGNELCVAFEFWEVGARRKCCEGAKHLIFQRMPQRKNHHQGRNKRTPILYSSPLKLIRLNRSAGPNVRTTTASPAR